MKSPEFLIKGVFYKPDEILKYAELRLKTLKLVPLYGVPRFPLLP